MSRKKNRRGPAMVYPVSDSHVAQAANPKFLNGGVQFLGDSKAFIQCRQKNPASGRGFGRGTAYGRLARCYLIKDYPRFRAVSNVHFQAGEYSPLKMPQPTCPEAANTKSPLPTEAEPRRWPRMAYFNRYPLPPAAPGWRFEFIWQMSRLARARFIFALKLPRRRQSGRCRGVSA